MVYLYSPNKLLPQDFLHECALICKAYSDELDLFHIGSTALEGLYAKLH